MRWRAYTRGGPWTRVLYFKYAGDKMADGSGKEYVVLHENDILAIM